MKNFREYNAHDSTFLKNHDVSKKHETNVFEYESQIPIDWHEVKINLDGTVVEKYLNNQKSNCSISPSHREKNFLQKIPRLNQNVFSEKSNVMVKLEIPNDIGVDNNLSPADSLVFPTAPIKQEDISAQDSLEPLREDFQGQDDSNFTGEALLKNEVIEFESCYEETTIGQEFKNVLKNEELFVGQEFKHEESVPSYENVESIDQENKEETIKKRTRSTRKRKRCLNCDDCSHGLGKKSRVPLHSQVVTPKLYAKDPKKCKSQTTSKPIKSKSFLRAKEQKNNQESSTKPKSQKGEYRIYHCAHCDYKAHREALIEHCRNKHPYIFIKDPVPCTNCGEEFPSKNEMLRHRYVCLTSLICKFCLVKVPKKTGMMEHMKTMHHEKIHVEEDGKSLDEICAKKMLELTPFGQSYVEIRNFYLNMESEHIRLYCLRCEVTRDIIMNRTAVRCDSCRSRMLYQCQKCKETRNQHSDIWNHLMNKTSDCSISKSFIGDVEPANQVPRVLSNETESFTGDDESSTNQAPKISSNVAKSFKETTKMQLNEHIQNVHLNNGITRNDIRNFFHFGEVRSIKHERLCGITIRFPCRFCPTTCCDTNILFEHIVIMHRDKVDGKDIDEFIKEARNFRRMVKDVNDKRFNDKLRNGTSETETDHYHHGIESMLQTVCIKCKADGPHNGKYCAKCQENLNFVCLRCDELFSKYSVAWDHATRMCENRSFTLTVGKTRKNSIKHELFYCEHCNFKYTSKLVLCNHIEIAHNESPNIQNLLSYPRHLAFLYTCQFCTKRSTNFHVIEKHIAWSHHNHFRCENTLEEILDRVMKNRRPIGKAIKPSYKYDDFGRRIRRTFSENLKLAIFYCANCDETVSKNFRKVTDTRKCPKCNYKLLKYCKVCDKVYIYWAQIAAHFQSTICGDAKIEEYDMDHSYCIRQFLPEITKNSLDET